MICPNCGAEMERHAFTHVCSYCGYIHAGKETKRNIPRGKTEDSSRFYDYISKHLQYIQQSPFVDIEPKHDCYVCISSKPFYANDGHYTLDKSLSFWWHAKVTKLGIAFNLLVKPKHTNSRNYLCIKEGRNVFSFKQKGEILDKLIFPMTLEDFLFFCNLNNFELDTNLYDLAYQNNYQEFMTYTHRFYHIVIDVSKYRYSINIKLLTD